MRSAVSMDEPQLRTVDADLRAVSIESLASGDVERLRTEREREGCKECEKRLHFLMMMPPSNHLRVEKLSSILPRFHKRSYAGSSSATIAFSSCNSFTVASIFERLKSFTGTPCTISHSSGTGTRIGKLQMIPFSIP